MLVFTKPTQFAINSIINMEQAPNLTQLNELSIKLLTLLISHTTRLPTLFGIGSMANTLQSFKSVLNKTITEIKNSNLTEIEKQQYYNEIQTLVYKIKPSIDKYDKSEFLIIDSIIKENPASKNIVSFSRK